MIARAVLALLLMLGVASAQEPSEAPFVPPSWINRPHDRDMSAYMPLPARRARVSGRVELSCIILLDTRLDCTVAVEEPTGWGFGEAALRLSRTWRINPATRGGVPVEGVRLRVPLRFR